MPRIRGDEIADTQNVSVLRKAATRYALDHWADRQVEVASDGQKVRLTRAAARKTTNGQRKLNELRAVAAVPEMVRAAKLVRIESDRQGRPEILRIHVYASFVEIGRKVEAFTIIVRETREGLLYYDQHMEKRKPAG